MSCLEIVSFVMHNIIGTPAAETTHCY